MRQSLQNENDALEAELLLEEKDLSELRSSLSADEFRPKALAFDQKVTITGCTVHFVDEKLDSGKIILQQKVRLFKSDTPKTLAKRILKVENKLYPKAINKLLSKT